MAHPSTLRVRCYTVLDPKRIKISITSQDTSKPLPADLVEISPISAMLLLSAPPAIKGECQISLTTEKLASPLMIPARVDWMRPNAAGVWQLGCAIEPALDPATFKKLITSGLLERRAAPREPVHIPVEVQLVADSPKIKAIVRNISEGGLCCLATNCPPQQTRIVTMFVVDSGREIRMQLKVRWSMQAGGDHFLGCQFVRQSDFAVLRRIQGRQPDTNERTDQALSESHAVAK
jgi:hypothetical protein